MREWWTARQQYAYCLYLLPTERRSLEYNPCISEDIFIMALRGKRLYSEICVLVAMSGTMAVNGPFNLSQEDNFVRVYYI